MRSFRARLRPLLLALALAAVPQATSAGDFCQRSGNAIAITIPEGNLGVFSVVNDQLLRVEIDGVAQDCDGARNDDTSLVFVDGTTGDEVFRLDQSGPGGPANRSIIFQVDLGIGTDRFSIRGTPKADRINIGTVANNGETQDVVDPDGDRQPNVDLLQTEVVERLASGGNDRVSGTPGNPLGPARLPLVLKGGSGADTLVGGNADDVLVGGAKSDDLNGKKGKDLLKGGGGEDGCNGGPGKDRERGCE